jgi:hypothetical protein
MAELVELQMAELLADKLELPDNLELPDILELPAITGTGSDITTTVIIFFTGIFFITKRNLLAGKHPSEYNLAFTSARSYP